MAFTVEIVSSFSFRQKFQKDSPIFLLPSFPSYPRLTLPIHPFSTFIAPTVSKLSQLIEPRLRITEEFLRQIFLVKNFVALLEQFLLFCHCHRKSMTIGLGTRKTINNCKTRSLCAKGIDLSLRLSNHYKLSKHRNIVK